jgi:hypothetical protein
MHHRHASPPCITAMHQRHASPPCITAMHHPHPNRYAPPPLAVQVAPDGRVFTSRAAVARLL